MCSTLCLSIKLPETVTASQSIDSAILFPTITIDIIYAISITLMVDWC